MPESGSILGMESAIRNEEEACEVFCTQIRHGLESIRNGKVYSIDEAWREIDSI